jgi:thioredoxin-dependent peroxiredoxin
MTNLQPILYKWIVIALVAMGLHVVQPCLAAPLQPGQQAPSFSANSSQAGTVTLDALKGKPVILVFYPADYTPGCTVQLCSLRDHYAEVKTAGATVLGINPASVDSHKSFAQKHQLPFPLLEDKQNRIAKAYGVGNSWGFNTRTVFVVGPDGRILFVDEGMPSIEKLLNVITAQKTLPGRVQPKPAAKTSNQPFNNRP